MRTQALNAAHETLTDPARRRAYDAELRSAETPDPRVRGRIAKNISHDLKLRIEDLFRGASIQIEVRDPANEAGVEAYTLTVPPMTAPGSRFRLPRNETANGGDVVVRVGVMPSARWKARGSDLRTDLRIQARRAADGGTEMISGPTGNSVRVPIPARVGRGEIIKINGEGLPKPHGGRGDLLVRITYRLEVRAVRR